MPALPRKDRSGVIPSFVWRHVGQAVRVCLSVVPQGTGDLTSQGVLDGIGRRGSSFSQCSRAIGGVLHWLYRDVDPCSARGTVEILAAVSVRAIQERQHVSQDDFRTWLET